MSHRTSPKKTLLRDFLDNVWSAGDVSDLSRFLAPTYTVRHDPGDPWQFQTLSQEGFKDRVVKSRAMAPDQTFHIASMVEEEECVAVSWTWTGTHKGDIPGIAVTDRPIKMSGLTIYDFTEGKLSGHWQIADRLSVYQQVSQP
jgi:predicted ester cyclase